MEHGIYRYNIICSMPKVSLADVYGTFVINIPILLTYIGILNIKHRDIHCPVIFLYKKNLSALFLFILYYIYSDTR